jgi:hypothetical protein
LVKRLEAKLPEYYHSCRLQGLPAQYKYKPFYRNQPKMKILFPALPALKGRAIQGRVIQGRAIQGRAIQTNKKY